MYAHVIKFYNLICTLCSTCVIATWHLLTVLYMYAYYASGNKLTELYVRRNQLSDFSELEHLTALPNLTVGGSLAVHVVFV